MECLEYGKTDTSQNLKEQIEELVQNQKLSEVEAKCVRVSDIRGLWSVIWAEDEGGSA